MSQNQDTIVTALMEQLIAEGPDGMAQVFTALFNLAMRLDTLRRLLNANALGGGLVEVDRLRWRRLTTSQLQMRENICGTFRYPVALSNLAGLRRPLIA